MDPNDHPEDQAPACEHGVQMGDVIHVTAKDVGIVHDDDVTPMDIVAETVKRGADCVDGGDDVRRVILKDRNQLSVGVLQGTGEIMPFAQVGSKRRANDRVAHLLDEACQRIVNDLDRDGIELGRRFRVPTLRCQRHRSRLLFRWFDHGQATVDEGTDVPCNGLLPSNPVERPWSLRLRRRWPGLKIRPATEAGIAHKPGCRGTGRRNRPPGSP